MATITNGAIVADAVSFEATDCSKSSRVRRGSRAIIWGPTIPQPSSPMIPPAVPSDIAMATLVQPEMSNLDVIAGITKNGENPPMTGMARYNPNRAISPTRLRILTGLKYRGVWWRAGPRTWQPSVVSVTLANGDRGGSAVKGRYHWGSSCCRIHRSQESVLPTSQTVTVAVCICTFRRPEPRRSPLGLAHRTETPRWVRKHSGCDC